MAEVDFLINDDIRQIEIGRYEEILNDYISALQKLPGVCAVYQLGNIRVPGISDIDVIVVVDNDIPVGTDFWSLLSASTGPDGPYIFSHPSYVIGIEEFPDLPALFYADNLRHRWGETIEFRKVDDQQQRFYDYKIALESAIVQSFVFMRSLHNRTATNLRSLVCNLNAIRHNFTTLGRWADQSDRPHWSDYVARIDKLRSGWFQTDRKERIAEVKALMGLASELLAEIIDELYRIGLENEYFPKHDAERWFSLLDINILLHFSPDEQVGISRLTNPASWVRHNSLLKRPLSRSPRVRSLFNDVSVLGLPAPMYGLIGASIDDQGHVARILRKRRLFADGAEPDLPPVIRDWVTDREHILNRYLAFVSDAELTGLLHLTAASWMQVADTVPNQLRILWNKRWVLRSIDGGRGRSS
jgi:hypothetical protein